MERSVTCKLRLSKNIDSNAPAFLVDFSNGRLDVNDTTDVNFQCYRRSEDQDTINSNFRRILHASSGRLSYNSSTSDENRDVNLSQRYLIGVRKKSTGRMKVYDCVRFRMNPVLKSVKDPEQSIDERNYREQLEDLTMSFGSKGKKRAIASRLKFNSSTLEDDVESLQNDSALITPKRTQLTRDTSAVMEYVPQQNSDAETVQEVYNIQDIISLEEDAHLNLEAETLKGEYATKVSQWGHDGTYCRYVLSHLETGISDEKLKYLIYYNYLVSFSKLTYRDMRKKDPAPEIPEPYKSKMIDFFTISSTKDGRVSRNFPEKMKDKALAYLLVLALFIDDFCVNLSSVLNDLKVSVKKITDISQVVGCYVTSRKVQDSLVKFAELKLPLFSLPGHNFKWKR